jgi:hypothetical protein
MQSVGRTQRSCFGVQPRVGASHRVQIITIGRRRGVFRSGRGLIWEMLDAWKRETAHDGADRGPVQLKATGSMQAVSCVDCGGCREEE